MTIVLITFEKCGGMQAFHFGNDSILHLNLNVKQISHITEIIN